MRDRRIVELERRTAALLRELAAIKTRNAELEKRNAELEEKVRKSSANSSKPPSTDSPAMKAKRAKKKPGRGRKRGGQPGHTKHERALVPPEEVTQLVHVVPTNCENCEHPLRGRDPEPERHQGFEIPRFKPIVTEHRLHALGCTCGHITRAELPAGVSHKAFGPTVQAHVALLIGAYRLSKRKVVGIMSDVYGLPMSVGSVVNCQSEAGEAMAPVHAEALVAAQEQPVKHSDETSWREGAKKAWLWVLATPLIAVFMIAGTRSRPEAQALLGRVRGILVSDRYSAYLYWPVAFRQVCWSHLKRDFAAIAERAGTSGVYGLGLLRQRRLLFEQWHRVRTGELTRAKFQQWVERPGGVRAMIEGTLRFAAHDPNAKTAGTAKEMLTVIDAFWTFVRQPGVEPTNNFAEQIIRHAVLFRKISFGTDSARGSRFVERVLTAQACCILQKRNLLTFLIDACKARRSGTAPPSLVPGCDRVVEHTPLAA